MRQSHHCRLRTKSISLPFQVGASPAAPGTACNPTQAVNDLCGAVRVNRRGKRAGEGFADGLLQGP